MLIWTNLLARYDGSESLLDVRIYLRLSGSLNAEFDTLKARLGEVTGDQCGVRETVIVFEFAISQLQSSTAKAAF